MCISISYVFLCMFFLLVEIRNHGVGYYQFSTSKGERQEQMKALDKLREQVRCVLTLETKLNKYIILDAIKIKCGRSNA